MPRIFDQASQREDRFDKVGMIIVADNSGRTCNRLLLFAHVCATALESGQRLVHLTAKDVVSFARLDPAVLSENRITCFPFIPGLTFLLRLRAAYYERIRPFNVSKYVAGNENRVRRLSRHSILPHFLVCWFYRDTGALIRNRAAICRILAPKDEFVKAPKSFAENIRKQGGRLVGVHLRRGDYREFADGRFYFSDVEYLRFIQEADSALGGINTFILVSDEAIDCSFFMKEARKLDILVFKGGNFREDLVMLSLCDCIMGPWSSFSWWAAYSGGGLLCHIKDRTDRINPDSFRKLDGAEI